MIRNPEFDDIRPYYDDEVNEAVQRIVADPLFKSIAGHFFPDIPFEMIKEKISKIDSSIGFQIEVMHKVINTILLRTSKGLTFSGFDKLSNDNPCLFISNHRDILLDSAILQMVLHDNKLNTSEITFGSNLMSSQLSIDIGKINRMFTVFRSNSGREFIKNSTHLSKYIRHTITEKKVSVWIAQRNGRTKDGNDFTEQGLIKMLLMSGDNDIVKNFTQLNLRPMVISFEYEPCDVLKTNELYQSQLGPYVKKPGEDINSIVAGIIQPKGRIHIAICDSISDNLHDLESITNHNERIKKICSLIDHEIYKNQMLWKTNYIAYDLLNNSSKYEQHYSESEKKDFINYTHQQISKIDGDKDIIKSVFLSMYANSVVNFEKLSFSDFNN